MTCPARLRMRLAMLAIVWALYLGPRRGLPSSRALRWGF
jgi:hypothetical protein